MKSTALAIVSVPECYNSYTDLPDLPGQFGIEHFCSLSWDEE